MKIPKAPIDRCPFCGSTDGYYTKEQVHGEVNFRHNFDGSEAENGDMYENLSFSGGKYAYCLNCGKRLFPMDGLRG